MSLDLPGRLDLHRIARRYVLSRQRDLDPAIVDTRGSDADLFLSSQAFVADAVVRQVAAAVATLLFGSARGDDLDRIVLDRCGGPGNEPAARKGAAAALVDLSFSRPNTLAGAGSIPIGTRVVSIPGGVEYVTAEVAAFGAGVLSVAPVVARAVSAGKAFQVGANALRKFAQAPFDPTIAVNNPAPAAGGEDRESDGEYLERARDLWRTARRGILAAIELGARSVPGISSAMAVEELTPIAQPARVVNLYVADSSGVASRPLGRAVVERLLDYRAAGITVVVTLSTPQLVAVKLALAFLPGVQTVALSEEIRAAVFAYVNSLPVNGPLYRSALSQVLQRFAPRGLVPQASSVVVPAGDLIPEPGQTLRVRLEDVALE